MVVLTSPEVEPNKSKDSDPAAEIEEPPEKSGNEEGKKIDAADISAIRPCYGQVNAPVDPEDIVIIEDTLNTSQEEAKDISIV